MKTILAFREFNQNKNECRKFLLVNLGFGHGSILRMMFAYKTPIILFEVREFAEDFEALFDFFALQVAQAMRAEVFYGKGSHDAAIE